MAACHRVLVAADVKILVAMTAMYCIGVIIVLIVTDGIVVAKTGITDVRVRFLDVVETSCFHGHYIEDDADETYQRDGTKEKVED